MKAAAVKGALAATMTAARAEGAGVVVVVMTAGVAAAVVATAVVAVAAAVTKRTTKGDARAAARGDASNDASADDAPAERSVRRAAPGVRRPRKGCTCGQPALRRRCDLPERPAQQRGDQPGSHAQDKH